MAKGDFGRGVVKGAGAFGTGFAAQLGLKAASGKTITNVASASSFDFINPATGLRGVAGATALTAGLVLSGIGDSGKKEKRRTVAKIVGYGILAIIGATLAVNTLDPDPDVMAEYRNWIPGYAPQITFPVPQPTPPTEAISDVWTQVPHYENVF